MTKKLMQQSAQQTHPDDTNYHIKYMHTHYPILISPVGYKVISS